MLQRNLLVFFGSLFGCQKCVIPRLPTSICIAVTGTGLNIYVTIIIAYYRCVQSNRHKINLSSLFLKNVYQKRKGGVYEKAYAVHGRCLSMLYWVNGYP